MITFKDYYLTWLEVYKADNTKETLKSLKSIFNNHILPYLQDRPINELSSLELNKLIAKVKKSRAKEYVSQYLKQIMKQAYNDNIISNDIHESIIKYKHKRKEGQALSKEQRLTFLKCCKLVKHGEALIFAYYTGVRRSELLKFTSSNIFENVLNIPGTKTSYSNRFLPRFKPLESILGQIDDKGFNISESTLKRTISKMRELCGFKFVFKDLRTTFGTMCAEMGIVDTVIAKWMGHTNTNTTKKYYIKILSKFEETQAKIFNEENGYKSS